MRELDLLVWEFVVAWWLTSAEFFSLRLLTYAGLQQRVVLINPFLASVSRLGGNDCNSFLETVPALMI